MCEIRTRTEGAPVEQDAMAQYRFIASRGRPRRSTSANPLRPSMSPERYRTTSRNPGAPTGVSANQGINTQRVDSVSFTRRMKGNS